LLIGLASRISATLAGMRLAARFIEMLPAKSR
jgi:hypothetical protein